MSAATQTVLSPTSSDSAPTRHCPEPTMNVSESSSETVGSEGVASFVADNLKEKSEELGYLCGRVYLLCDATSYEVVEKQAGHHCKDEWCFASTFDPRKDQKVEALSGIAEEVGALGVQVEEKSGRLASPEGTLRGAARAVAEELEKMGGRMRVSYNRVAVVRRALMYDFARIQMDKAERRKATGKGAGKLYSKDLRTDMESQPVVKQLRELGRDLFEFGGWFDELARRLRAAFPKEG